MGPYRGVGRPLTTFVTEGLIDRAARRLGRDAAELRLQNSIRAQDFPYKTPSGIVWDRASLIECLEKARAVLDEQTTRHWQAEARGGRPLGRHRFCQLYRVNRGGLGHSGFSGHAGLDRDRGGVLTGGPVGDGHRHVQRCSPRSGA